MSDGSGGGGISNSGGGGIHLHSIIKHRDTSVINTIITIIIIVIIIIVINQYCHQSLLLSRCNINIISNGIQINLIYICKNHL